MFPRSRPTTSGPVRAASFAFLIVLAGIAAMMTACEDGPTGPTVCTVGISPASRSFDASAGTGTVAVSASDASCAWTATASASWVTVTAGASGSGNGTVTYQVAANPDAATRTATVTIEGETHLITQTGQTPACTYVLSPASVTFGDRGGAGTLAVTAPDGCGWAATSSQPWAVVTSGSSGSGNGTVGFMVGEHNGFGDRTATIVVGGQTFAILQMAEALACSFSVAPVSFSPCLPGGTFTTTVMASSPVCAWTVSTSAPWLTLASGAAGAGTADIQFVVGSNYDAPREGLVMIRWDTPTAGQNALVKQAGCLYSVTQSSFMFTAVGGADMFDVFQFADPNSCGGPLQNACVWSAVSDVPWIVVTTSMPRQGDDRVSFTVQANGTGVARTGTIIVKDKVVQIAQGG
jgi:hypothetical protein